MNDAAMHKEALRQQMLLRALWRDCTPGVVGGWLRDGPPLRARSGGLPANAGALAERALVAAFPTVQQLVGDESFAALARAFWHAEPPGRGDIGSWGEGLARLHRCRVAAGRRTLPGRRRPARLGGAQGRTGGRRRGADRDSSAWPMPTRRACACTLQPCNAVVDSVHPVATIWLAHRSDAADRFDSVREALAQGRAEAALVRRRGLKAEVQWLSPAAARFTIRLLHGGTLAAALDAAGAEFDFEPWLIDALQAGSLAVVSEDRS